MINAVELRPGSVFAENGTLYEVITFQVHRMSQAQSVCRLKLKDLNSGSVVETSKRSTEVIKNLNVERRKKTFLYFEGGLAHFMDMETYEQIVFPEVKLGDNAKFLTENLEVEALYGDDKVLDVILPKNVPLKVVSAPPGMRGDSATNPSKPVECENGITVQAPVFIKAGDVIRVDVESHEYIARI
ncbi:MAG: elongation factor P [Elusimicrobiota bacterium]